MGEVVNLNKFRKKKAKIAKEKRAETNRRLHGRTREEREREEAQKARLDKTVRGAFLERTATSAVTEDSIQGDAAVGNSTRDDSATVGENVGSSRENPEAPSES